MADDSSETVNSAMFERGAACIVVNMDPSRAAVYSGEGGAHIPSNGFSASISVGPFLIEMKSRKPPFLQTRMRPLGRDPKYSR